MKLLAFLKSCFAPTPQIARLNRWLLGIIALLVCGLFILGWVANARYISRLHYAWGEPDLELKIRYLHQAKAENYNTVFIGSSRTYHQIDPYLFDKITGRKSFNLGRPRLIPWESFVITENFLEAPPPGIKTVFIEARFLGREDYLKDLARHSYYKRWADMGDELSAILQSSGSFKEKARFLAATIALYLYRYSSPESLRWARQSMTAKRSLKGGFDYLRSTRGFMPLEDGHSPTFAAERRKWLASIGSATHLETYDSLKQWLQINERHREANEALYRQYQSLINRGKRHGIQVIPYIPAPIEWKNLRETYSYYDRLKPMTFDMADISESDYFWRVENCYASHHLKPHAAKVYTEVLAKKFLELSKIKPE